ncbi:YihY/virulence factor BrkB family protein [Motilibacter sp. E257]|uniref:YihY/virulence factor BrkB family protein n=1 Tax=Motilibacter deserti TaxID=2714956 RepID=A0ABX0GUM8_9ACTN|nr:YihY/virulence factor BrkB family protein [Motilibacter deserti]
MRMLLRDAFGALRGRDVALVSAGLTFYAGIAVVPSLLVAIWAASLAVGNAQLDEWARTLGEALPEALGAPDAARALVEAALDLSVLGALIAAFPASLYGEGLRRSFLALERRTEALAGWRGRLRALPLLVVAPLAVMGVLLTTPWLARFFDSGRPGPTALGVFIALVADWLVLSLPLSYTYRVVGRSTRTWASALWSGFTTASFISGFLQGFVLFLALPLDLGAPFGGLTVIGAVVAVGLWMWVLHMVLLVGYTLTLALEERGGNPFRLPYSL